MPLTPMDIHNKEFAHSFRGYSVEEVNEFLNRVAKDFEQVLRETLELKEQNEKLGEKIKGYQKLEETMHSAIVVAQEAADEVKQNARREADLIRREAENEARRIVEESRYRSSRILTEHDDLFKQAQVFKMRFRAFLESQIAALELEEWDESPSQQQLPQSSPSASGPTLTEPSPTQQSPPPLTGEDSKYED